MTSKFVLVYFCTNKIENMRLIIRDAKRIPVERINETWREGRLSPRLIGPLESLKCSDGGIRASLTPKTYSTVITGFHVARLRQ